MERLLKEKRNRSEAGKSEKTQISPLSSTERKSVWHTVKGKEKFLSRIREFQPTRTNRLSVEKSVSTIYEKNFPESAE